MADPGEPATCIDPRRGRADGDRNRRDDTGCRQLLLGKGLCRHPGTDWLARKLATKETRVVALANRMARTIFVLLCDGTSYRPRVGAMPG